MTDDITNSGIIRLALEHVLEVYEDLDSWQSLVGEGKSEHLDDATEIAARSLQELVALYKVLEHLDAQPGPEGIVELDEEGKVVAWEEIRTIEYLQSDALPSIIDTTEYEN